METTELILSDKLDKLLKDNISIKERKSSIGKLDTTLLDRISKKGLLEKVEYTLPLNDTLGQKFFNASKGTQKISFKQMKYSSYVIKVLMLCSFIIFASCDDKAVVQMGTISLSGDLDFGEVEVNTSSEKTLTISNIGNQSFDASSIILPSNVYTVDWDAGTISTGGSKEVTVIFRPTSVENYDGIVSVNHTVAGGTNTIPITGSGVTSIISVSGRLDFGEVEVGSSSEITFTISNTGTQNFDVSSIDFPSNVFTADWTTGTVNARDSVDVTVAFSPTNQQSYSGTVTVNHDATSGTDTLSISGSGGSGGSSEANVYTGDITFSVQTEVDRFAYTEVTGNLEIGSKTITSLSGLDQITSVGGSLKINYNDRLTSLSGLDQITSVGGSLRIESNALLTSLSGLDQITSVGGGLSIKSNAALTSLSELDQITSVGGNLEINNNVALTSLSGLDQITSVSGFLSIHENVLLTSFSGLDQITSMGGGLSIQSNAALTSLSGLDQITSVGGSLRIESNNRLTSLSGLDQITSVGGSLRIRDNARLVDFCAISSLVTREVSSNVYSVQHNAYNPNYEQVQSSSTCRE